jgi:hypothetical protein
MKQKASGWCAATCVVSVNNALGGNGTIDKGVTAGNFRSSDGYVYNWNYGFTKKDATVSLAAIKSCIDSGYYVFVRMTGSGGQHWVVVYEVIGTGGSRDKFSCMDPRDGTHCLLSEAFNKGPYDTLTDVFYAVS